MADSSPLDVIIEFLRRNKFTKAEAALQSELGNRPDLNGILQKLTLDEKESGTRSSEAANGGIVVEEDRKTKTTRHSGESLKDLSTSSSADASKELIVKEVECGTGRNGSETKWKSCGTIGEQSKVNESFGTTDKNFTFSKDSDDTVLDLYSRKYSMSNGPVTLYQNDGVSADENNFSGFQVPGKTRLKSAESLDSGRVNQKSGEDASFSGEKRMSWPGSVSNVSVRSKHDKSEHMEVNQQRKASMYSMDELEDNSWSRNDVPANPSSEHRKECSVKTVFPFSRGDTSTSHDTAVAVVDKKDGKRKSELNDIRAAIKEQVDEVGRALFLGKTQVAEPEDFGALEFHLASENQKEELPRLPPVKLKSEAKPFNIHWEEKYERDGPAPKILNADNAYLIGSFLDVPIGQEINSSGKRMAGGSWLSVSQGIAEDTSDLVSGFATIGDGLSESIDYPNEYWDSDEYEDDDDVGYMRQPIEDETWFLAHEIDYPSDNEKGTGHGSVPDPQEMGQNKNDEDDQSFAEEDSYISGERYFQSKKVDSIVPSDDPVGLSDTEVYRRNNENNLIDKYDGQLMDVEELNLMRAEPVWQGFVTQTNELIMLGDGKVINEHGRPRPDDLYMDDEQHGSVRSIGVGINSDVADIGSEVRESLVGGSSEGDIDYFHDHDVSICGSRHSQHDLDKNAGEQSKKDKNRTKRHSSDKSVLSNDKGGNARAMEAHKDASSIKSSRDENNTSAVESANSSPSSLSNYGYIDREYVQKKEDVKTTGIREEDPGASLEDEEVVAVQEQKCITILKSKPYLAILLKWVAMTGFEEDKNFHVVLNSVIAGRYHVTEYLGSAAFSKAIQAHDLHTGMDVCVKIIKNNKDFFDQSLDEIKLLKYVNKHDPADKYHILRLYDYFYYREHLLIVCELLKANLYEFHKFNRESGGEVYFTMPRLQSITIQCLEALQFLHSLGLIHCDLKPENILVKSYSRCEVKVIDLGSSCFETDHLCSYVQSRSYRAPEVLFQNDSPATLLARVIGIIGPIEQEMLAKGRDTYKYFTKNHMLYERNQDTNRLEYLIPKKSSLRHRLPMGDQGFIDFVAHLLEVNPKKRPSASEALKHPWLQYPYEPISS
ncbi:UNVERIFIED_CONTAM: putative serine/threonine-protein kinase dyrk2 [Sesamum calycinum]|uniref:Serine/threonine-protein kinase dyrk2 n=1 Tax=Sesamum calycinum TaxID=2727403 RepID=A0AAW2NCA6_9LAMI